MARLLTNISRTLLLCLLALSMPLAGEDAPQLTEALVEQRIATLREGSSNDSEETLTAYSTV